VKSLFLVNARSGTARKFDIAALIRDACKSWDSQFDITACGRKEELDTILDDAERDGYDVVYAVGGDGTVHEIAKRLTGRKLALGILPIGSGNGFARHLGLPMEPRACLNSCNQRRIVTIDTAEVNGVRFLGVMGIGFDAWVADRFAVAGSRGLATYVKVGFREVLGYRAEEYEITIDGVTRRMKAKIVAIANSSQYGNDAKIAPHASVQDGLLDVVTIADVPLIAAPSLALRLFNGTLDRSPHVTITRGREITIRRPFAGPAHLDGEPFTLESVLNVHVRPASLKVLLPDAAGNI
jgi:diacylglycerol kinase (ATP)